MNDGLVALQQRLQHQFTNAPLLNQAVTHRSFSADHNERLEFLGDSVLNLAVADLLYQRLGALPEGDLSRVRANLVKQDTLHQLAVTLGLPEVIRLGEGEVRSGGQKRPSILADALEALIGAVYLDAGYASAEALVRLATDADAQHPFGTGTEELYVRVHTDEGVTGHANIGTVDSAAFVREAGAVRTFTPRYCACRAPAGRWG